MENMFRLGIFTKSTGAGICESVMKSKKNTLSGKNGRTNILSGEKWQLVSWIYHLQGAVPTKLESYHHSE